MPPEMFRPAQEGIPGHCRQNEETDEPGCSPENHAPADAGCRRHTPSARPPPPDRTGQAEVESTGIAPGNTVAFPWDQPQDRHSSPAPLSGRQPRSSRRPGSEPCPARISAQKSPGISIHAMRGKKKDLRNLIRGDPAACRVEILDLIASIAFGLKGSRIRSALHGAAAQEQHVMEIMSGGIVYRTVINRPALIVPDSSAPVVAPIVGASRGQATRVLKSRGAQRSRRGCPP